METLLAKIGRLNNTCQKSTQQTIILTLTTVIEMLKDRGYSNIKSCQTFDEIVQNMTDLRYIVCGTMDKSFINVFFHNEERVGVRQLRQWVESSTADRIIVVSLDGPTAFTRKEAEQNYKQVQFFTFRDLCVNITRHTLVPKHERIDGAKLPLGLTESKAELPILYTNDRIAQYYAFAPGDVVRITRTAGVQEPVYYYRIVRTSASS